MSATLLSVTITNIRFISFRLLSWRKNCGSTMNRWIRTEFGLTAGFWVWCPAFFPIGVWDNGTISWFVFPVIIDRCSQEPWELILRHPYHLSLLEYHGKNRRLQGSSAHKIQVRKNSTGLNKMSEKPQKSPEDGPAGLRSGSCLFDFEGFLHLADDALGKELCIMLSDSCRTMS